MIVSQDEVYDIFMVAGAIDLVDDPDLDTFEDRFKQNNRKSGQQRINEAKIIFKHFLPGLKTGMLFFEV